MDEKKLEEKIEFIAVTTLGALKNIFKLNKFDDREATLALYYFINQFVKHGWKGEKPSVVLENAVEVIKAAKGDTPIYPTELKGKWVGS